MNVFNPNQEFEYRIINNVVPDKQVFANSRAIRPKYVGNSYYRNLVEAEKTEMIKLLSDNGGVYAGDQVRAENFVRSIPNAKYSWVHRLLKQIATTKEYNPCDLTLASSITKYSGNDFNTTALNAMIEHYGAKASVTAQPITDYPSKGNMQMTCRSGTLTSNLKNPGIYNVLTGQVENYPDYPSMYQAIDKYNYGQLSRRNNELLNPYQRMDRYYNNVQRLPEYENIQNNTKQCKDEDHSCSCNKEESSMLELSTRDLVSIMRQHYRRMIQSDVEPNTDSALSDYMTLFVQEYLQGQISDKTLTRLRNKLNVLYDDDTNTYLKSLLNPFARINAKIPTSVPVPSASIQVMDKLLLTTNASGNAAVAWNPFNFGNTNTSLIGVNNDVSLTGIVASNFYLAQATSLILPVAFYAQYRLVSAALKLRYLGSKLNASGRLDVALDYSATSATPVAPATAIAAYGKYGQFSQIQNAYFYDSINNSADRPEIQVNYLPSDNIMTSYIAINTQLANAPVLLAACIGGQASSACVELTIVANYECILENEYMDYIPTSFYKGSIKQKEATFNKISEAISTNDKKIIDQIGYVNPGFIIPSKDIEKATGNWFTNFIDFATDLPPGFKFIKDVYRGKDIGATLAEQIKRTGDIATMVTSPEVAALMKAFSQSTPSEQKDVVYKIGNDNKLSGEQKSDLIGLLKNTPNEKGNVF